MAVAANHNHDNALLNGAVENDHTGAIRALRGSGGEPDGRMEPVLQVRTREFVRAFKLV